MVDIYEKWNIIFFVEIEDIEFLCWIGEDENIESESEGEK